MANTAAIKGSSEINEALLLIKSHLGNSLLGQDQAIELSLCCLLAGGHLLLEGPPGTGKTSLAQSLAKCFGGNFRRVQMTSDLLPSDVVGVLRPKQHSQELEFRPGPIFTNFLLADELNRTSPKTQAALLEAMAEGTVSVDGTSHELPKPFFVIATQNPLDFQGVYPLPESQLDRFMMQLFISHPDADQELEIYRRETREIALKVLPHSLDLALLKSLQDSARKIFIEESVLLYCQQLVAATRSDQRIRHGASVRAGLQFLQSVRALALVKGRSFVIPEDCQELIAPILAHRLSFTDTSLAPLNKINILQEISSGVTPPK